jgi:hypothetical protein
MQQFQPLRLQRGGENAYPGNISAGPINAFDKTQLDWVSSNRADDWDRTSRRLGDEIAATSCDDDCHLSSDQISRQFCHPFAMTFCPAEFEPGILSLNDTGFI